MYFFQSRCPNPTTVIGDPSKRFYNPIRTTDITWNFEKFLIDHNGNPRKRYAPGFKPQNMRDDIKNLVNECMQNGKATKLQDVFDEA